MTKSRKKFFIIIFSLLIIIFLIFFSVIYVKNYYSPYSSVKRMFSLRAKMKLEEYYECFDIPEYSKNLTNTKDAYLAYAEEKNFKEINSFEIEEIDKNTFKIEYDGIVEELKLVKQNNQKAWGIFDTYKIQIESVSSPVLYIITPIDAILTIDGTVVSSSLKVKEADIENKYDELSENSQDNLTKDLKNISSRNNPIDYYEFYDERYDHYCFINAFYKNYEITVITDYTEPYTANLSPDDEAYILRNLTLKEKDENEIRELSQTFAKKFYYSMQDGEDFEVLSSFLSESGNIENLKNYYEELQKMFIINEDPVGYFDLCINEFIINVYTPNTFDMNQSEYTSEINITYSYGYTEYDAISNAYDTYTNEISDMCIRIKCIKENGKWTVSDAESLDMIF